MSQKSNSPQGLRGPQGNRSHWPSSIDHRARQGQLLVSHAHNDPQWALNRSVVLITHHMATGAAAGLQINHALDHFNTLQLAQSMGLDVGTWTQSHANLTAMPLYYGGNRHAHRAQVIHTRDWSSAATRVLTEDLAVTSDISILAAMVSGQGPQQFRVCVGTWIWTNLDRELTLQQAGRHSWEVVPAADAKLVFDLDSDAQWQQCLSLAVQHNVDRWL
jgi:putative AlgH/UPF0301 family transcriptional regulator